MAKQLNKLTAISVRNARMPGKLGDGGGLYLQISRWNTKAWIFRFKINGKGREMGLGSEADVSLAKAREIAMQCRLLLKDGIDPIENRKSIVHGNQISAAKRITFMECSSAFIDSQRAGWRNHKHVAQWSNTLARYAHPVIGKLPVSEVDTSLVVKILEPIWKTKTETASRVRGRVESVLDWAKVRGYREGENPARWRGHLDKLFPRRSQVASVEHHKALHYNELPQFMGSLNQQLGVANLALEFVILTVVRTGEMREAKWDEFDMKNATWTIPASRMKAKKIHRVPLVKRALEIAHEMKDTFESPYVFPGDTPNGPLSDNAMLALLERMSVDVTVHGFRSTFRDWVAECTNHPSFLAEAALAHTIKNKVEAAYQRGDLFDKRRLLMQDWESFCLNRT